MIAITRYILTGDWRDFATVPEVLTIVPGGLVKGSPEAKAWKARVDHLRDNLPPRKFVPVLGHDGLT